LLIDRRPHLAGNCYDPIGADGLQYHQYGPHIFHTNAEHVVAYLSAFTAWRPFEHRVLANVDGRLVPIPINQTTINALYGLELDQAGVGAFLARVAEPRAEIRTSEDVIVARVGRELYERFFRGYTRKHWGRDPAELDASVCGRIPARTNADDRYFTDRFQMMPADGYAAMVERMTAHPRIERVLGVGYHEIADRARFRHIVFTGPIVLQWISVAWGLDLINEDRTLSFVGGYQHEQAFSIILLTFLYITVFVSRLGVIASYLRLLIVAAGLAYANYRTTILAATAPTGVMEHGSPDSAATRRSTRWPAPTACACAVR